MAQDVLRRVLVVEDDSDIQTVIDFALAEVGGLDVLSCSSGSAAVAQAAEFGPDMILLDVMMPEMDGPATLAAIRCLPETMTTPIVFVTAKVRSEEVANYHTLGVADIISKPFDPMALPAMLDDIWGRLHTVLPAHTAVTTPVPMR